MIANQTKHDNQTINRVRAILGQNKINFQVLQDRIISIQLFEPREFRLMQGLLPKSGNSAIGRALTHKPPLIPKFRPDSCRNGYRILLQCK